MTTMNSTNKGISIPYDIFESPKELVIIIPVAGVSQDSISLKIDQYKLHIKAMRKRPQLKDDLVPKQEKCYRGPVSLIIDLPPNIYFDRIHSKLSKDNVLSIIIPKNIIPDQIPVELDRED